MSSELPEETPIETVERLSTLSRIAIPESQKEVIAAQFADILTYIAQLDELTLEASDTVLPPLHNMFREDGQPNEPGMWTEEIVRAFPAATGNALSVKKIITHD